ncbi:hypothetical protein LIPSTDRAFT_123619 [Lipomyces starkeyi NRRL Y-11557]|uniref:Uncharacterized protein n=1 Tax=Lipomyces starkeyi NRRL Y-11557 TaxID=675824 RepID=A0A1E3QEM0_LIPST|nr:hypothetical protein LIPSTDRAFT_123619 [Lipomyces starkeyi NRRL Y-11557]
MYSCMPILHCALPISAAGLMLSLKMNIVKYFTRIRRAPENSCRPCWAPSTITCNVSGETSSMCLGIDNRLQGPEHVGDSAIDCGQLVRFSFRMVRKRQKISFVNGGECRILLKQNLSRSKIKLQHTRHALTQCNWVRVIFISSFI